MSAYLDADPAESTTEWTQPSLKRWKMFRLVGSILQLLVVAFLFEMLIGVSDAIGAPLRLFLFTVFMAGVAVRAGWLSMIAIQFSLLLQSPVRGQLAQVATGFFWVMVAMLTIISAMKLPRAHRSVTDYILKSAGLRKQTSDTKQTIPLSVVSLAVQLLQLTLAVVFAVVILLNIPIGRQSGRWLQSSVQSGQAFWPGTLWLVLLVALFVVARELTWRKIDGKQASVYLRSVQLIANYRDLYRFDRERHKRQKRESDAIPPTPLPTSTQTATKRSKLLKRNAKDMTDSKGAT